MGLQAELEILEHDPLVGRLRIDDGQPVEFHGWAELRSHLAGTAGDAAASLSHQERRVASLAAEGLSNAAVAERLSLSPRTVQWHLNKAYKKLGVRSRTKLAIRLLNDNHEPL